MLYWKIKSITMQMSWMMNKMQSDAEASLQQRNANEVCYSFNGRLS